MQLFVGVALVAFIRKVLVASLGGHDLWTEGLYLAGILVCGVIFWLVSQAEAPSGESDYSVFQKSLLQKSHWVKKDKLHQRSC